MLFLVRHGLRFLIALVCAAALSLVGAAVASATTVQFASPTYSVSENVGSAPLTLTRTGNTKSTSTIYWFTEQPSAVDDAIPGLDYTETNTHHPASVTFAAGQTSASIQVPVVNHGMPGPTKQFSVKIFAKGLVGSADVASVQILGNDPMPAVHDPADPLALQATGLGYTTLPTTAPTGPLAANPLAGVKFYTAPLVPPNAIISQPQTTLFLEQSGANMAKYKAKLQPIWGQPQQMRYGTWDIDKNGVDRTAIDLNNYLEYAESVSPNTVPEILTYDLCHNSCKLPGNGKPTIVPVKPCGQKADGPAEVAAFENFINDMASGISDHRVVLYLEMDGLITMQCETSAGKATRLKELTYAINTLSTLPRAAIYVDAGASDAGQQKVIAGYLKQIGVSKITGFFLNSTHADWTLNEIAYGQKIVRQLGGNVHFVVNTTVNGRGPEATKHRTTEGNEVLCNPTKQGLGPKPTTNTGYWHVDAFAWMNFAGLSDGPCHSDPSNPFQEPTGVYIPKYAELLISRADYKVTGTVHNVKKS